MEASTWEGREWLRQRAVPARNLESSTSLELTRARVKEESTEKSFVAYSSTEEKLPKTFKFLSYHTLSNYKCSFIHYSTARNWDLRKHALFNEIMSYNADIICLQDVDHITDWWKPQFTRIGYDTIYKQRTQLKDFHYEGVLIAIRRASFQIFKTVQLEFNDAVESNERGSAFKEQSLTDDVALIAFIQPLHERCVETALCIASVMLSDSINNGEVRMVQCQYLARQIEKANKEFHVPVLVGMSAHDIPSSLPYQLMATGRLPLSGQVPKKCPKIYGTATCRGSVLLKWLPPKTNIADPPLICFRIAYRPGGSSIMDFKTQLEISVGDCVKYAEQVDRDRNVRMVAMDERQYTIVGLCSEVPYEFKVTAVNEFGEGTWSDISRPVVLPNPEKAPEMPQLQNFHDLKALNQKLEEKQMHSDDWNVQRAFQDGPMAAETQLTPRDIDGNMASKYTVRGRVLPYSENPRSGWKDSLHGQPDPRVDEEMMKESVLVNSLLRDHQGFKRRELNSYTESIDDDYYGGSGERGESITATNVEHNQPVDGDLSVGSQNGVNEGKKSGDSYIPADNEHPQSASESNVDNEERGVVVVEEEYNEDDDDDDDGSYEDFGTMPSGAMESRTTALGSRRAEIAAAKEETRRKKAALKKKKLLSAIDEDAARLRDKGVVVLDGREVFDKLGIPNPRQVHNLLLRSAYEGYSVAGEPIATASFPREKSKLGTECLDYIFYSAGLLVVRSLLAVPQLSQLNDGENPQDICATADVNSVAPHYCCQAAFDTPLKTFFQRMNTSAVDESDLLSSTDDPRHAKMVSKSSIHEAKRVLRDALKRSHIAGNRGASLQRSAQTSSEFWGGKWPTFPIHNHQRKNYYLPNDRFPSSHIALAAEFEIQSDLLSTKWGYK